MKKICHIFLTVCKGYKVETWYTHEQWADVLCIPKSGPRALNPLIGFTICHKLKIFITDFSGTMKAIKLKLGAHIDNRLL